MPDMPETHELHRLSQIMQALDCGLLIVDTNLRVQLWNQFMETHSGTRAAQAKGELLTELCPELPARWLQHKVATAVELKAQTYSNWQQRPYLFQFSSSRPVTGQAPAMLQNISFIPLSELDKSVQRVCIVVQDVTEFANQQHQASEE
ncbi:PAS domain-containing protein [Aliidiomarina sp. Khilg15.8]